MNIGLVISGNLTGFSRFYATANVNDQYKEAKIDFDYRNFLTFLEEGEKVYALSFAPTAIAVSLVTRILDSFRRPGVLVVSLLMPRHTSLESSVGVQGSAAIYRLLNEINGKFYEKNFINGMVNQNAAVLMQDYYSEILNNYQLVNDAKQRDINRTIDNTVTNKRVGYIQSMEDNMGAYLSTPCRNNYEGYHHIFISPKAPQNIEEEPVEVVFYDAHIKNNNRRIPHVRLTDKIPHIMPEMGEKEIEQDFTYQQVLDNEAPRIQATFVGETIELVYHFIPEERTIKFVYMDGVNPVDAREIQAMFEYSTGGRFNVFEEYQFRGKEISTPISFLCGNSNYAIKPESRILDISRLKDGATYTVYVEQSFNVPFVFPINMSQQKDITLKRYGVAPVIERNVTNKVTIALAGKPDEWDYTIDSRFYEPVSGNVGKLLVGDERINLQPKRRVIVDTPTTRGVPQTIVRATQSNRPFVSPSTNLFDKPNDASGHHQKVDGQKKWYTALLALVVIALVYLSVAYGQDWPPFSHDTVVVEDKGVARKDSTVTFRVQFVDYDGNGFDNDNDTVKTILSRFDVEFKSSNEDVKIVKAKSKFSLSYKADINDEEKIVPSVYFTFEEKNKDKQITLLREPVEIAIGNVRDTIKLKLLLYEKDVLSYYEILAKQKQEMKRDDKRNLKKEIDKERNKGRKLESYNKEFYVYLCGLIDNIKEESEAVPANPGSTSATGDKQTLSSTESGREIDLDSKIPKPISDKISSFNISDEDINSSDLDEGYKDFLLGFKKWQDTVYNNKDPRQRKTIFDELKEMKENNGGTLKYRDVETIMKKYKGNK